MTDTDKRQGSIYINRHERPDVVDYRNCLCDQCFNKYLPYMSYFEGLDMKILEPELKAGK